MSARLSLSDLNPETRAQLAAQLAGAGGRRKGKRGRVTMETVRSRALLILAELADLPQAARRRVLEQAQKVNAV